MALALHPGHQSQSGKNCLNTWRMRISHKSFVGIPMSHFVEKTVTRSFAMLEVLVRLWMAIRDLLGFYWRSIHPGNKPFLFAA